MEQIRLSEYRPDFLIVWLADTLVELDIDYETSRWTGSHDDG